MSQKSDSLKNDTKIVKVTVVVVYNENGTYFRNNKDDPVLQVLEPILLAILFLIAFAINMFLLVTIVSSFTLRKVPFNVLLANISIACLPECLFNILIAVYYTTADSWKLGSIMCSISAFTIQIVTLEITFGLCIMCVEGSISLWRPSTFQNYLTVKKQIVAIVTLWLAGVLLCIPVLVGSIASKAFPSRYGCGSAGKDVYAYSLFMTLWCYVIPLLLGLFSFVYLAIRKYKDYKARKSKKHDINYSDILFQGDLWTEWVNIKLVSLIALFYIILELPYIVVHQKSSIKNYDNEMHENVTLPLIERTPTYETTFTWFRYIFVCIYPVVGFWMRKDIRRKCQSLLSCCQKNTIRDNSPLPIMRENKKKKKDDRKEDITPLSLTTPVLYISPEGLCLRQLDSRAKFNKAKKHLPSLHENLNWTVEPSFVSYLCDVNYSAIDKECVDSAKTNLHDDDTCKRRDSNESGISLSTLESDLEDLSLPKDLTPTELSQEKKSLEVEAIPNSVVEFEPKVKKTKKVRFAETLTIYKSITPTFCSPSPEKLEQKIGFSKPLVTLSKSKIPTRRYPTNAAPPWKVEMNETYRVSAPVSDRKNIRSVVPANKANIRSQEQRNANKSKTVSKKLIKSVIIQ